MYLPYEQIKYFAGINNYQFQQNHHKTVITENCCLQKIVTQFDYKLNRWIQTVKLRNLFNLWPPKRKSQKYLVTFLNSQLNRFHLYLCTFFADKLQKKICITHTHNTNYFNWKPLAPVKFRNRLRYIIIIYIWKSDGKEFCTVCETNRTEKIVLHVIVCLIGLLF